VGLASLSVEMQAQHLTCKLYARARNPHRIFTGPRPTSATVHEITADNVIEAPPMPQHGPQEPLPKLMLGAIGVVYGDIGTSPLYTMKESFLV